MIKHNIFAASAYLLMTLSAFGAQKVTAYLDSGTLAVKSAFTAAEDIVIVTRIPNEPNECAYLVPKGSDIREYKKGVLLHSGGDDMGPWFFQGQGYIGANHGSMFGHTIVAPGHGLGIKDIGSRITCDGKTSPVFYVIKIMDKDRILVHPEHPEWLAAGNKEKLLLNGKLLPCKEIQRVTQLKPCSRIRKISFLADGKTPLPQKKIVECSFVDHIVELELIMPENVVRRAKEAPGKEIDFVSPDFQEILSDKIVYRFQPLSACVITHETEFKVNRPGTVKNGITQYIWSAYLAGLPLQEFYIPKLKPLKIMGMDKKTVYAFDFSSVANIPQAMNVDYHIAKKDCLDPEDMPDRFVRLCGKGKREYGFVIGYSLLDGITAKSNKSAERPCAFYLYRTKKLYPECFELTKTEKSRKLRVISYRQYFDPTADPEATACYHHAEGNSEIVYFDCHKKLASHAIVLPPEFAGRNVTVVEKTPSIRLLSGEKVLEDGIKIAVDSNYGYIVIKLDR